MRRWSCWMPGRRLLSETCIGMILPFSAAIHWLHYLFEVDLQPSNFCCHYYFVSAALGCNLACHGAQFFVFSNEV